MSNTIKFVALAVSFLLISLSAFAVTTTIHVQIDNPTEDCFWISLPLDILSNKQRTIRISLNAEQPATAALDIAEAGMVILRHGQLSMPLYLQPGATSNLRFDVKDFLGSFKAEGDHAADHEFLVKSRDLSSSNFIRPQGISEYLPATFDETSIRRAEQADMDTYFTQLQNARTEKKNRVDNEFGLSPAFRRYLNVSIQYNHAAHQFLYYVLNKNQFDESMIMTHIKHNKLLDRVDLGSADFAHHPDYIRFVTAYAHAMNLYKKRDQRGVAFDYHRAIEEELIGQPQALLFSRLFYQTFQFGPLELLASKYPTFRKSTSYKKYTNQLDEWFGDSFDLQADTEVPNFRFPNTEGKVISLKDFRGQVVYLSFWATWCKPCLKGFEQSETIRQQLVKEGVVLINISIDEDPAVWRKTMQRIPMPGINVLATQQQILQLYGISALPAYYIVNKAGNFTYLPDEGYRDIVDEFKKLVSE